jgi:hypothetical protein
MGKESKWKDTETSLKDHELRLLGPKNDEMTGEWELHNPVPYITRMNELRVCMCTEQVREK